MEITCLEYPEHHCSNCGYTCKEDDDVACASWEPTRGTHPSTPNPCEGYYDKWEDYPLCAGKCEKCKHAAFMK